MFNIKFTIIKIMKNRYFRLIGFFLLILGNFLFQSCVSTPTKINPEISPVYITNTKKFYLLSPENIEKDIDCLQLLTGSFGSSSFFLQAFLKADKNGIYLSLLNDFGTGMGNLSYDGYSISFDSLVFPKALKAEYIASDLQFAYYKTDSIKESLEKINLDFVVSYIDDEETRLIMNKNKCVEKITKSKGLIKIENYLRGYEYNLQEALE